MESDLFFDAQLEIKEAVSEEGVFVGYGAVYGNVDSGRDRILEGAFGKSIEKQGSRGVKMLWQHDTTKPIGVWTEIYEESKGIRVKGQLILDVQQGREAYALMKAGALDGLSIGFSLKADGYEVNAKERVREIKEGFLHEISLVTFPMNTRARVNRVKGLFDLCQTKRELERTLRDVGFSKREAMIMASACPRWDTSEKLKDLEQFLTDFNQRLSHD